MENMEWKYFAYIGLKKKEGIERVKFLIVDKEVERWEIRDFNKYLKSDYFYNNFSSKRILP